MDTVNRSVCDNVSLDLSESSIRFTTHPQLLVVMTILMCLVAVFIVGSNVLLIMAFAYSRYYGKFINRTEKNGGFSDPKKILSVSFCLAHLVIGGFCMPLAIVQVVQNGQWNLGAKLCMARVFAEVLSEIINIYHAICMCIDNFIMVKMPLKYRLLTSKTGYCMAIFSWTIPVVVFALSYFLGWNSEGIESKLHCLKERNLCVAIFSKKFVFLIVPTAVFISIVALVVMAAIILKEIHRFHKKKTKQKDHNGFKKANQARTEINDAHTKKSTEWYNFYKFNRENNEKCPKNCTSRAKTYSNAVITTHQEAEISLSAITNTSVQISLISLEVDLSKAIETPSRTENKIFPAKSITTKTRKTFGILITLVTMQGLYLIAFMVVTALLVFNMGLFPLWLNSIIIWLRYLHSASIPVLLFKSKPTRTLIQSFLNAL